MALFTNETFLKYDDYSTPFKAWNDINQFIPINCNIWSPFYLDGKQKELFLRLGYDIYHEKKDFFMYEPDNYDIIIDNPPFDKKKEVLTRLKQLDKPFIIICPSSMINTVYFRDLFRNSNIQLLIPRRRIQFIKDGLNTENRCNFDCFYYCYKMNLEKDIIFLD